MVRAGTLLEVSVTNPWIIGSVIVFVILILYFLLKFFSVFFEFIQAKGCMTVGLLALVGLPGLFILSFLSGSTWISSLLMVFAAIGVVTGYIVRDSEGNVGKFGLFIMIVSGITLVAALLFTYVLRVF